MSMFLKRRKFTKGNTVMFTNARNKLEETVIFKARTVSKAFGVYRQ